jgi:hypothetical protein
MIGKLSLTDNNVCKTKCHQDTPLLEKMTLMQQIKLTVLLDTFIFMRVAKVQDV